MTSFSFKGKNEEKITGIPRFQYKIEDALILKLGQFGENNFLFYIRQQNVLKMKFVSFLSLKRIHFKSEVQLLEYIPLQLTTEIM